METIKRAAPADCSAIRELNTLLRLPDVKRFYWDSEEYVRSAIEEGRCFVIKSGKRLRASMILEDRDPDERCPQRFLAIGILAVHPGSQKEGLGVALVRMAEQVAFQGNALLYVESFFEYRKSGFYKQLGFQEDVPKQYDGKPYHVLFLNPRSGKAPTREATSHTVARPTQHTAADPER
jgi:GNAT superfamily N-acetyltransferase